MRSGVQPSLVRRLALLAVGGALMFYGRRGRLAGRIAVSIGAAIAGRALAGNDDLAVLSRAGLPARPGAAVREPA